jgi:hypothetical protein
MGDIKQEFGTSGAITVTLASLAGAAARQSAFVDNGTDKFFDVMVYLAVALQAGTPADLKRIQVYAYGSEDGTNYTDNASGSDAAITLRVPTNLRLIGVMATPDSGALTYKSEPMSLRKQFGFLPRRWGIVVVNRTNVVFSATEGDHKKSYSGVYATSA